MWASLYSNILGLKLLNHHNGPACHGICNTNAPYGSRQRQDLCSAMHTWASCPKTDQRANQTAAMACLLLNALQVCCTPAPCNARASNPAAIMTSSSICELATKKHHCRHAYAKHCQCWWHRTASLAGHSV
jgi:hypothetical protein